jgi:hypothetical protein
LIVLVWLANSIRAKLGMFKPKAIVLFGEKLDGGRILRQTVAQQ